MTTTVLTQLSDTRASFLRTRLGSLLAFLPLGLWTANHLWNNLAAFRGAAEWQEAVTHYSHPIAHMATMVMVLLPLVLHTAWGIGRLFTTRANPGRYMYYANVKYLLQRLSAVGLMLFLGAHLWLAMIHPRAVEGHAETFGDISHEMRTHLPTLIVYLLGTAGVAYHLANGLHTLTLGWGVVSSRAALRRLEVAAIGVFLLLLGIGWAAIYALYSAGVA